MALQSAPEHLRSDEKYRFHPGLPKVSPHPRFRVKFFSQDIMSAHLSASLFASRSLGNHPASFGVLGSVHSLISCSACIPQFPITLRSSQHLSRLSLIS